MIEADEKLAKAQEKQVEVNVVILQRLSELHKQGILGSNHGDREKEKTNEADGSRSQRSHRLDRDDIVKSGIILDTPDKMTSTQGFYSNSSSKRHHHHHHQHHRRSEYFLEEFKKSQPPTFYGEMMKLEDAETWLFGMRIFFRLHDYLENMKSKMATLSIKGKSYILWEYIKNVRGIREEKLTWNEFERIFKKKIMSERYYDGKAKEFYELKVGSKTNEEYTTQFLEL